MHRLGNLVLLSRRKNAWAGNFDFETWNRPSENVADGRKGNLFCHKVRRIWFCRRITTRVITVVQFRGGGELQGGFKSQDVVRLVGISYRQARLLGQSSVGMKSARRFKPLYVGPVRPKIRRAECNADIAPCQEARVGGKAPPVDL